jgi:hypothetical protein
MEMSEGQFAQFLQAMITTMRETATNAPAAGGATMHTGGMRSQLSFKGFDGIEVFKGGEEQWTSWSWKLKVAIGAMHPNLAQAVKQVESLEPMKASELLDRFNVEQEQKLSIMKASQELYSVLVRFTAGEAANVVRATDALDGLEAWGRLNAAYHRRTLGRMVRVQRECLYPRPVKELAMLRVAVLEWERRWEAMMMELGKEAVIPDLWRMSALLEICPKELKEAMLMKLDEVGESYGALKEKIINYAINKTEASRSVGGATPMDIDEVDYEEYEDEVGAVWKDAQCYACGEHGHLARDCPWAKGKGKGKAMMRGTAKGKGKGEMGGGKEGGKGKGKKGWGKAVGKIGGWSAEGFGGNGGKGYKGMCWNCGRVGHKANECPEAWGVQWVEEHDQESDEEQSEDVGGVFDVDEWNSRGPWTIAGVDVVERCEGEHRGPEGGKVAKAKKEKKGDAMEVNVEVLAEMSKTKKIGAKSEKERRKTRARERATEIFNDQGSEGLHGHGLCGNKTGTGCTKKCVGRCKHGLDKERFNRFELLREIDEEEELEVNQVEEIDEVVEVTVDSGAARSVWPLGRKGVTRTKLTKAVKLAAANGSPIHVAGEATLNFKKGDRECQMKFLDAQVRRPLVSVTAIVDEGNVVVFGPNESFVECSKTGQRIEMIRKNGVFMLQLEVDEEKKKKATVERSRMEVNEVDIRDGTKAKKGKVNPRVGFSGQA